MEKFLCRIKVQAKEKTGLDTAEALGELLEKQAGQIDFVHGSGRRKSQAQKDWEELNTLYEGWKEYEKSLNML